MTLVYEIWLQLDYQIPLTKAAVKFPTDPKALQSMC